MIRYKILEILKMNNKSEEWQEKNRRFIKMIKQYSDKIYNIILTFNKENINKSNLFKEQQIST